MNREPTKRYTYETWDDIVVAAHENCGCWAGILLAGIALLALLS